MGARAHAHALPRALSTSEDLREPFSLLGWGWEGVHLPHGEGNVNPLQCSCLENPMDRGAWWATVRVVAKSPTRLSY